ncbi:hypothetical protein TNCV_1366081 [Trichonephila clavipes]|nr:hypothetical protein TNCV_1366081 [Trichonephila clavipes]
MFFNLMPWYEAWDSPLPVMGIEDFFDFEAQSINIQSSANSNIKSCTRQFTQAYSAPTVTKTVEREEFAPFKIRNQCSERTANKVEWRIK